MVCSSTVSSGKVAVVCCVPTTPRRARSRWVASSRRSPPRAIEPESGRARREGPQRRCLARSVWPDQRMHGRPASVEIEIVERDEALEALGEPACGERALALDGWGAVPPAQAERTSCEDPRRRPTSRGRSAEGPDRRARGRAAGRSPSASPRGVPAGARAARPPARRVREGGDEEEPSDRDRADPSAADDDCDEEREGERQARTPTGRRPARARLPALPRDRRSQPRR